MAHCRELYLIPTGDIAAVVFTTELLTQLRNKGVDIDKVCSSKARQDGKLLDKTQNTKYAAQQVADLIHGWVPTRAADPETQHEADTAPKPIGTAPSTIGRRCSHTNHSRSHKTVCFQPSCHTHSSCIHENFE